MIFKKASVYDYLVVGLGNPGKEYENTRHNVGFRAADILADDFSVSLWKKKLNALICDCKIKDKRVLLCKPLTFMNLSGQAVGPLSKFYKIPKENIILIFDDISLPVGKIRLRAKGTHGGHNGMKNISEIMSTTELKRVKIGVGEKPHPDYDLKDWVLGSFTKQENEAIESALKKAADAVKEIICADITSAMNKFNS